MLWLVAGLSVQCSPQALLLGEENHIHVTLIRVPLGDNAQWLTCAAHVRLLGASRTRTRRLEDILLDLMLSI